MRTHLRAVSICLLILLAVVGCGYSFRWTDKKAITSRQVQVVIIQTERPKMGQRELDFWTDAIASSAAKYKLPPEIVTAKIAQETQFNQHLVSSTGARCAAQIMPVHYKSPDEIKEVEDCLDKGAEVLAKYVVECGSLEVGLRCYYAGPQNVKGTPDKGRKLYRWYSDAILARVYLAEQGLRAKETRQ